MPRDRGRRFAGVICVLAVVLLARPARAQFDISGEWATRYNEDAPHRGSVEIAD